MEPGFGERLLEGLSEVRWDVAARTFGNDHATLIGLIVHWWIAGSPETRTALDGGPSDGDIHDGLCDALLCENEKAVGLLEVEGTRIADTVKKIGSFFAARHWSELQSLEFAILVAYAYQPTGRGEARTLPPAWNEGFRKAAVDVSARYPNKAVVAVTLDKLYERQVPGIRARNEYYWGRPSLITGILYQGGQEMARRVYYECR